MPRIPYRGGGQRDGGGGRGAGRGRGSKVTKSRGSLSITRKQHVDRRNEGGRGRGRGGRGRVVDGRGLGGHNQNGGGGRQATTTSTPAPMKTTNQSEEEVKVVKERPPTPWRNSQAKMKLNSLLRDESSWVQGLAPFQIWFFDEDFKKYDEGRFKTNCQNLMDKINNEKDAVDFDAMALANDRSLYPKHVRRYEGSAAEKKLKEDVQSGRSMSMAPKLLWELTPAYQSTFDSLKKFRNHKYKEERVIKEKVYWQKKRNDKARKKHEEDVVKLQEDK